MSSGNGHHEVADLLARIVELEEELRVARAAVAVRQLYACRASADCISADPVGADGLCAWHRNHHGRRRHALDMAIARRESKCHAHPNTAARGIVEDPTGYPNPACRTCLDAATGGDDRSTALVGAERGDDK